MSEDTYTESQIREANFRMLETVFEDDPFTDTTDALITELQRPAWVPDEGEVVAGKNNSSLYRVQNPATLIPNEWRPLTLKEHGNAVRALRDATMDYMMDKCSAVALGNALTAFDEAVR